MARKGSNGDSTEADQAGVHLAGTDLGATTSLPLSFSFLWNIYHVRTRTSQYNISNVDGMGVNRKMMC
jgi:hypothetical protein